MTVKLTLSVNKDVVAKAKRYSRKKGKSLSKLIENYLKNIIDTGDKKEDELHPDVKKFSGAFKLSDKRDYKEVYREEMIKKNNH
jgi:hypothetical protein